MIAANEVGDDKVFECEDNHLIVLSRTARHDLGSASKSDSRATPDRAHCGGARGALERCVARGHRSRHRPCLTGLR